MEINKENKSDLRFKQEDDAVWVFSGDSHQGTEISHLITSHIDDYNEDDVRLICHYASNEIDRLRAKLAKATPEEFVFNDIFAERKRQIDQEHYSHEHDDKYDQNELIRAASSYLSHVIGRGWVFKETRPETYQDEEAPDLWPWDLDFWKPKNPRRDLVRAAALIIAEIEKIDRSTGAKS